MIPVSSALTDIAFTRGFGVFFLLTFVARGHHYGVWEGMAHC